MNPSTELFVPSVLRRQGKNNDNCSTSITSEERLMFNDKISSNEYKITKPGATIQYNTNKRSNKLEAKVKGIHEEFGEQYTVMINKD